MTIPSPDDSKSTAGPDADGQISDEEVLKIAYEAEQIHKRINAADQSQLPDAIAAGELLIKLKGAVGHGPFEGKVRELYRTKKITFKLRTARRYMRVARYAPILKTARVAGLRLAEEYIVNFEADAKRRSPTETADQQEDSTRLDDAIVDHVVDRVLKQLGKATGAELRELLTAVIARLNQEVAALQ